MGRLGCRLGVKIVLSPRVALVFLKIDFLKKMKVQEATWVDFWVDLGRPRGVKMRAAEGLKRS